MIPFVFFPATCELCGNWLPEHQSSCPRNGVHPSQWTCAESLEEGVFRYATQEEDFLTYAIKDRTLLENTSED
ncbi:hypothetical protein BY458DRAFT_463086 [Sporodiniella umbellata]|nr:hypothetical protein BY458DRAFT_463086 [Sporodiniella umbellata]